MENEEAPVYHYEDYYCAEFNKCPEIKLGDDWSGHPKLVECKECRARMCADDIIPPEVGMPATVWCWTDRTPCTVIEASEKVLVVQEDNYERTDKGGMTESQQYTYSPNPEGTKHVFTKRKDGKWHEKGSSMKNGMRVHVGHRRRYYDFSF